MKRLLLILTFVILICNSKGQQYLSSNNISGSGSAEPESFVTDETQNTYISGFFTGQLKYNDQLPAITAQGRDIFFAKYNDDQQEQWFIVIGGSQNERYSKLAFSKEGDVMIAGTYTGSCNFGSTDGNTYTLTSPPLSSGANIFLAQYKPNGELRWAKCIVAGEGLQYLTAMAVDPVGNVLISATTAGNAFFPPSSEILLTPNMGFLAKFSSVGDYQWVSTFQSSPNPATISGIAALDDYYYFTGFTQNELTYIDTQNKSTTIGENTSDIQYFVLGAIDTKGIFKWVKNSNSSQTTTARVITADDNNNIFVTGLYGSSDLEYDGKSLNLSHLGAEGKYAIYLLNVNNSDGSLLNAYSNGSTLDDYVYGLQVKNSLLYFCGQLGNQVTLPDSRVLPAGMFVAAYTINSDKTLTNIDVLEGVKADDAKGIVFSPKSFKLAGSFSQASVTIGDDEYTNSNPGTKDAYMAKACPIIGINAMVQNLTGCDITADKDGSITTDVVGGANPYTYVWGDKNGVMPGQTGPSISGLDTGKYTLLVIYNEGQCSKSKDFTITAPDAIYIKSADIGEADCTVENSTGSITVNAVYPAGKTVDYMAELVDFGLGAEYNSGWVSNKTFLNCPPGEYEISVRFTDDHACTASSNVGVSRVGSETLEVVGTVISYTCNIINDPAKVGQVTVSASATQDWFSLVDATTGATVQQVILTTPDDEHTFSELLPGSYKAKSGHFTENDPTDCMLVSEPINITQPKAVIITSVKPIDVQCAGAKTGGITVKATGDPGLIYELYNSTTPDVVVATNDNGKFTDLDGGTYNVTVWNATQTCSSSVNDITVNDLNVELTLSLVSQHDACAANVQGNPNGSIKLSASGGGRENETTTYTYTLTGTLGTDPYPNASGNFSKNVPADSYTATVMEQYSKCKATLDAPIEINTLPEVKFKEELDHGITSTAALCYGENNGKITVIGMTGGTETSYVVTAAYTSGGAEVGNKATQAPYEITGLYANDATNPFYYISLTDDYGCAASLTPQKVVTQPTALTVTLDATNSDVSIECYGYSDGRIIVTGAGGTRATNYTYILKKGGVTLTTNQEGQFENLSAGTYVVTITDDNDCEADSDPITIHQPSQPIKATLAITDVKCHGDATGRIQITQTVNGTSPYGYVLFNSAGASMTAETGAAHIYSNLLADTYMLTITDNKGCHQDSADIVVTQPATPVSIVSAVQTKLVSCLPGTDGAITVEANGGTGAYTYSSNGTSFSGDHILGGLAADTDAGYTVTVKDANACLATTNVKVRGAANPDLSASVVNSIVCRGQNGSIIINATPDNLDGSSLNTMSLYWVDGVGDTQYSTDHTDKTDYTGLNGGNYKLSAQDTYGCIGTETVILGEPAEAMGLEVTGVNPFGSTKGSITAAPTGGWLEYTITCYLVTPTGDDEKGVQSGNDQKTYTFAGLGVGQYKIISVDTKGCQIYKLQTLDMADGVDDLDAPSLKIFPNPSSDGRFIIEWDTKEDRKVTLEVYTTSGKLVYKTNVQTGTGGVRSSLDISSQSRGTYLLRVPELDIKQKLVVQ